MGTLKVWDGGVWQTVSQQGPAGVPGVPIGGTTGQVLGKRTATNYDTLWQDSGLGSGSSFVQSGVASGTTAANGDLLITFPAPFASAPTVVAVPYGMNYPLTTSVLGPTISNCVVRCFNPASGFAANVPMNLTWVAHGTRP